MKNHLLTIALFTLFILIGCKENDTSALINSSTTNQTKVYETKLLFVEPWGQADASTEVTGLAYDAANDQLFWIKSRWKLNNEVMRYKIATSEYDYVYSYPGQWDYGMRVAGNDLWLVKTYDTSIVKLSSLSRYPLTVQKMYVPTGTQPSLHNINDVAVVGGDLYFVSGDFLAIPTYNGVQCSRGPNYTGIEQITPDIWPRRNYVNSRSIVAVGNNLAIATGDSGAIELRTLRGALINSQAGYGNSYLQVDSRGRIYSLQTLPSPVKIIRWSSDLSTKEEFSLATSPSLIGSHRPLFVVREKNARTVDVIMTPFRGRSNPIFQMVSLPQ